MTEKFCDGCQEKIMEASGRNWHWWICREKFLPTSDDTTQCGEEFLTWKLVLTWFLHYFSVFSINFAFFCPSKHYTVILIFPMFFIMYFGRSRNWLFVTWACWAGSLPPDCCLRCLLMFSSASLWGVYHFFKLQVSFEEIKCKIFELFLFFFLCLFPKSMASGVHHLVALACRAYFFFFSLFSFSSLTSQQLWVCECVGCLICLFWDCCVVCEPLSFTGAPPLFSRLPGLSQLSRFWAFRFSTPPLLLVSPHSCNPCLLHPFHPFHYNPSLSLIHTLDLGKKHLLIRSADLETSLSQPTHYHQVGYREVPSFIWSEVVARTERKRSRSTEKNSASVDSPPSPSSSGAKKRRVDNKMESTNNGDSSLSKQQTILCVKGCGFFG